MWKNLQKLLDRLESRWSLYTAIAGTGAMGVISAWAAQASDWLDSFGPIAWVAAGLFGVFVCATLILVFVSIASIMAGTKLKRALASPRKSINPLQDLFEAERINIADFHRPWGGIWENKTFRNCEIFGPGIVLFAQNNHVSRALSIKCDGIQVSRQPKIWNAGPFSNSQFIGCTFFEVTFVGPSDDLQAMKIPLVN